MDLDWAVVRRRYEKEPTLRSLTGSAPVTVVDVDDERICLSQRLWRDCVSRAAIERALDLLERGVVPAEPIAFAEGLRRQEAHVETGCTRGPNLTAIVLKDLGYLAG
jgi:hypothetical protein